MDWDDGRGFLDVGAGARVFGMDMGLEIGRDDAGVDAFSRTFASDVVDRVFQATQEQLKKGLGNLADEVGADLQDAMREQVLGHVGARPADRLAHHGPIGDAIDRLIDAAVEERLASGNQQLTAQASRARQAAEDALANQCWGYCQQQLS